MIIIKRGRLTYYFKDESVIVGNSDFQFCSYNIYALQNRAPFYQFRDTLLNSKPEEYHNILDVIQLSTDLGIRGFATARPNLDNISIEYRK